MSNNYFATHGLGKWSPDSKEKAAPRAERKNAGKPDLSLLPPEALEELAKVLEFGTKKYTRAGWKKGMLYSVCCASALRHMFQMLKGQWLDEESGLPHAAHAVCNLCFILEYSKSKRASELNDLTKN